MDEPDEYDGPERRQDPKTRKRWLELEERVAKFQRRLRVAILVFGFGLTATVAGLAYLVGQNGNRVDDNKTTIADVQQSRRDSVRSSCREQNERHDSTVKTLDGLLKAAPDSAQEQIKQTRAFTVILIDTLVPVRNCEERVRQLIDFKPSKK